MIHGLVRCPSSYFDTTPTGRLVNKFSNDLGILDNTLSFVFVDMI
jgi:ATP-binding cassette subfamily C (CFTR/MRP) protein 1